MASKTETVLQAAKALVVAALPWADVVRNQDKADELSAPGGLVNMIDGVAEEQADSCISPIDYTHDIDLEVLAPLSADPDAILDEMCAAIGAAVAADRTLGGLCQYLQASPRRPANADRFGSETFRWAMVRLTADYASFDPLN